MNFSLTYKSVRTASQAPRTPTKRDVRRVKNVTVYGFAENRFDAYEACAATLSRGDWTQPVDWEFELNGCVCEIPLWILRFEETRISTGWGADDGSGIEVTVFYVVKPFAAFTPADIRLIEIDKETDEVCTYIRQYHGMDSGGVLWDTQYDLAVPVRELAEFISPWKTTYSEA
jgi:hypothetical protein